MTTTLHLKGRYAAFIMTMMLTVSVEVALSQQPPSPQPPTYTIKNLGTLCDPAQQFGCELEESFAYAVNNWGQVVGTSSLIGPFLPVRAFAAFRTGGNQAINPSTDRLDTQEYEAAALAINDYGHVVGSLLGPAFVNNTVRAFSFAGNGPMIFLPGFIGCPATTFFRACSRAFGINNWAAVVGSSAVDFGPMTSHAFRLTAFLQNLEDLGTLGGLQSVAYDINEFGLVVGGASSTGGTQYAVIFAGLSPLSLGTLGGRSCGTCESVAYAVNNGGDPDPTAPTTAQIVGESDLTATGPRHAFVLQLGPASLGMQDLGTLCATGDCDSAAYDINDLGQIVGESQFDSASLSKRAFIYKSNQMTDLNTLLAPADQAQWALGVARGINEFGQIVGTGRFDGRMRAYLMTPPLPHIFDVMMDLVDLFLGKVSAGIEQSLRATLQTAKASIGRGDRTAALGALGAFENQVRASTTGIEQNKLLAGAALIRGLIEEEARR